jgi:hypothetical protein
MTSSLMQGHAEHRVGIHADVRTVRLQFSPQGQPLSCRLPTLRIGPTAMRLFIPTVITGKA